MLDRLKMCMQSAGRAADAMLRRQRASVLVAWVLAFFVLAATPAWASCPSTVHLSVAAGGSVALDCPVAGGTDWGFNEVTTSHNYTTTYGHVGITNPATDVYASSYFNDSGAGSTDVFTIHDASNGSPVTFTIDIGAATSPISVSPVTLPAGQLGTAYNQQITATGGTAPYTYTLSGSLPPGLTMDATGKITGSPTGAGNYAFTVAIADSASNTLNKNYSITIPAPVLDLSPDSPPDGALGIPYSVTFTTSGGTAPYSYAVEAGLGDPPPGLSLSSAGVLSGTPTTTGTYTFEIRYDDSTTSSGGPGVQYFAAQYVTVKIVTATAPGAPTIGTATAGTGQASVSFTAPASNGGATISAYTVTSSPGGITASGSASPITVTGLTNGTAYTFTVTATNAAGTGPASAASNAVTPKASQTITFSNPGTQLFGTTPTLTASATSGSPVSFSSSTTSVCTITSGGTLTFHAAGTCTIAADQGGNGAYLPAPTVPQSFSVTAVAPGAPTIGTATAGSGQASIAFTAPASTGGAAISSYTVTSSPGGFTASGAASPITVTGLTNGTAYTFTVTATNSAGTGPASAASNAVTPKTSQIITFANPGPQNFGTTPTLTASATSGLTPTFSSSTTSVCTISSGGTLTFHAAGTCSIAADQNGDGTYLAATTVTQSFTVAAIAPDAPTIGTATAGNAQASVSFTAPTSAGGGTITGYTATSSPGGLTGTSAASPITVTGLTNGTAYTFTVTATTTAGTGPASAASNAVTPKGNQTITFANPGTQNFGTTPTLTASATSGSPVSFSSSTTAVCTISSGGTLTFHATGTCSISADQSGNGTYLAAPTVTQSFSVAGIAPDAPTIGTATAGNAQASVTFTAPASAGGGTITGYTATSSPGGLTGTGAASPITVTGLTNGTAYTFTVTATTAAGTGPASGASNAVTPKGNQTITFANPGTQNFGTTPTLTASASSGLTPTFSSSTTAVCTISSGGALTFHAAGTCSIAADQSGDGTYLAAPTVTQSFSVAGIAPDAPTIGTATAGNAQASVTFTAPASTGGGTITGYTVTASPGGSTTTGTSSPITVIGLTNGTAYTFTVTATTAAGTGPASAASNAVTPVAPVLTLAPAAGALPDAMVGEAYDQKITATGAVGGTPAFAVTTGQLPDGLSLAASGAITGKPTAAAEEKSFSFTITATGGGTGSAAYTIKVHKAAIVAHDMTQVVPPGATPVPVNLTAGATGGPFTDADVVDVEPASAGTASISGGKVAALGPTTPGFYLIFKPSKTFSGKAVVHFTLSSALGTSAPASVTYAITADPAQVSEAVSGLVHDFVSARQSLLANGIDAPGLLRRRAMEGGQQPGIVSMQPDGNTLTLNFASSLAEMRAWNAAADAAEGLATSDEPLPFNFWIDGTASLHVRDTDGDDHWGRFALMSMGADYLVNDKFLAGVAIYTDFMDDLTDTSTVSGKGLLAGPYASLEVGDGVFVDGLLLYGHSWNSVEAGSFAGDFETERLLAKLKVEGQWQLSDALVLRPNATAFYLREKAGDYDVTDGAGTVVNVAGFTSEQLRLSVGGRLDYTMLLDSGMTLVPYLGLDLGLSARDGSDLTDNAFGKLAVGFTLMNDNSLRLTGEVQVGAQADGLRSVSAKLSLGAGF